ncbi:MAG: ATP-binding cassette domain-containing protein [Clostridiales bacterium]|nr:ATP-binding cassette domain-containing protein [Clostridiales bacterium]
MFRKLYEPCGLHCIRINDIGVTVGEQEILKNVSLHIHCGTLAAVIGKNGAGKSTLIRAILGDIPHTGNIEFSMMAHSGDHAPGVSHSGDPAPGLSETSVHGHGVSYIAGYSRESSHDESPAPDETKMKLRGSAKSQNEASEFVRMPADKAEEKTVLPRGKGMELKIGYVPQNMNIEKKTPISVYDMIACYQSSYPVFWKKSRALNEKIRENLAVFQAEDLIDKQVCNLSGGEMQRVLLSMAIMDKPDLLLLDEPVSGIDQTGMAVFYQTISELKKNYDLAIILISHDLEYVAKYADQVILLDGQTVACQGSVRQVYESEAFARVFGV